MSVRSIFAAVLAAASLPFAAPLTAHADNNDCAVLDSQYNNINNLFQTAINFDNQAAATDNDDTDGYLTSMGLLRDTAYSLAERLGYVDSHLFNPAYKAVIGDWRNAWLTEAHWIDRLVSTRKVPPAMPDDINDRIRDGGSRYDDAYNSACGT